MANTSTIARPERVPAAMQDPIREAIRILIAEADSIRECHTPSSDRDDWASEPEAKAEYDRMRRVAGDLSKLSAPVADAVRLDFVASRCTIWDGEKQVMATREAIDAAMAGVASAPVSEERAPCLNIAAAARELAECLGGSWGDMQERERETMREFAKSVARAAMASAPVAGEAVGKVVLFGGDLKEVSWTGGKMPPPGTTLYAAPTASEAPIIEEIARQWDGCAYDAPGGPIDIGEAIRTTAKRNSVAQASEAVRDSAKRLHALVQEAISWLETGGGRADSLCADLRKALSAQPGAQKDRDQ